VGPDAGFRGPGIVHPAADSSGTPVGGGVGRGDGEGGDVRVGSAAGVARVGADGGGEVLDLVCFEGPVVPFAGPAGLVGTAGA
jgi:hypothetical protein